MMKLTGLIWFFCTAFCSGAFAQLLPSKALDTVRTYTSIEDALANPDKVYKLVLKRKKLKKIPPEVWQFKNLNYLDLSKNRLTVFPHEMGDLVFLQHLEMGTNQLDTIHPELGKLVHLRYLGFGNNEISFLPTEIGELAKLEVLDIWSNHIYFLPSEISDLTKLRKVDMRVIQLSWDQQEVIRDQLPDAKVNFSQHCNCD